MGVISTDHLSAGLPFPDIAVYEYCRRFFSDDVRVTRDMVAFYARCEAERKAEQGPLKPWPEREPDA